MCYRQFAFLCHFQLFRWTIMEHFQANFLAHWSPVSLMWESNRKAHVIIYFYTALQKNSLGVHILEIDNELEFSLNKRQCVCFKSPLPDHQTCVHSWQFSVLKGFQILRSILKHLILNKALHPRYFLHVLTPSSVAQLG